MFVKGLSGGLRGIKGPGRRGRGPQAFRSTSLSPLTFSSPQTNMFSRVATFALAALPLLAAATPVELDVRGGGGEPPSSCTTGPIQCCNTVEQVSTELMLFRQLPCKDSLYKIHSSGKRRARGFDHCRAWRRPPGPHRPRRPHLLPRHRHRRRRQRLLQRQRRVLPEQQLCEYSFQSACTSNGVLTRLRANRAASSPSAAFPSSSDRTSTHALDAYGRTGGVG